MIERSCTELPRSPTEQGTQAQGCEKLRTFVEKDMEIFDWRYLVGLAWGALGGVFGWFVAEFQPTFPLMIVVVLLIVSDAWTAYSLDKRVHLRYPHKTKRREARFTSFAFGKVIRQTIPKRLWLIIMAYAVERWIFVHVTIPLSYIVAGAIAFEQILSILENEASCREDDDEGRFWKMLKKLLIDKTERHWDVDLHNLRDEDDNTPKHEYNDNPEEVE